MTTAISDIRDSNTISDADVASFFASYWQAKMINKRNQILTESFLINSAESVLSFLKSKNCEFQNEKEITDFLKVHANIIDCLYEAPDVIFQYFGDVRLYLELFFDPETKNDEGELFLNIETDFDAKKAHEKLKEIDKEWLLKINKKDINLLNLNIEFI